LCPDLVALRLPWYRALPLSCIVGATLAIDGRDADPAALRLTVDGTVYGLDELATRYDSWWYVLDSAILSAPGVTVTAPGGPRAAAPGTRSSPASR